MITRIKPERPNAPPANPYHPPNAHESQLTHSDVLNPTKFSMIAWAIALPVHALAFRAALFFGQFPHGLVDGHQWDLYFIFGGSEFGYLFAAALVGLIFAEGYRHGTVKAISRFPSRGRFVGSIIGGCLFVTFMLTLATVPLIA